MLNRKLNGCPVPEPAFLVSACSPLAEHAAAQAVVWAAFLFDDLISVPEVIP